MAKKQPQAYTEEFRREVVLRAGKLGNNTSSVGKEFGISSHKFITGVASLTAYQISNLIP